MINIDNLSLTELSKEEMLQNEGGVIPIIAAAGWILGYAGGAALGAATVWGIVQVMK